MLTNVRPSSSFLQDSATLPSTTPSQRLKIKMSATDPKSPNSGVRVSDMDQVSTSSSLLFDDWSDLLDFNLADTDPFILPWDDSPSPPPPPPPPPPPATEPTPPPAPATSTAGKVRKRDPRLVCENFLAGRVPCACPEVDEMMLREEEERETAGGRKRARVRVREEVVLRCQVKGCEVDIRELKGYHRRHRVCLRCANATSVVIDGEEKRYCQQCGKFHVLPDFDEGKRSCRRKLERHNKRRRRRPTSAVSVVEAEQKGPQADLSEEAISDGDQKEENGSACETIPSSKVNVGELLLESDGHGSPVSSLPTSQNVHSNNIVSYVAAGEARIDEEKDNSMPALSSTNCNNRSAYSSLCPTGRISFKLYDWNPAEFPRRLRHQIFQWLASMPVELEGYVRPGCTILTIFIAMPQFMWEKLSEDATLYVRDLLNAPESLFLGRGNIFIFLSNMIIQVLKDGSSLTNIKMDVKAPRIHYVHPMYFEAGKPIEFVACGSNLNQPKFRFLVSFAGKYMIYDSCAISHGKIACYSCHDSDHEMFRICISWTDSKIFGPAFVEVENESGISNFIPILIGNKNICMELGKMQVALSGSFAESLASQIATYGVHPNLCELLVAKQTELSDLLVDVAWLLKEACIHENQAIFNPINVQRLICLLDITIQNELFNILKVILKYLEVMNGTVEIQDLECLISGADLKRLQSYVDRAKEILNQRGMHDVTSKVDLRVLKQKDVKPQTYVTSAQNQDEKAMSEDCMCSFSPTASRERDEDTPLVGPTQPDRKNTCSHLDWPKRSWARVFPQTIASTRLTLSVMVSVVMCLGVCIVLLHPRKPSETVVSIKRGLFGYPIP